MAYVDKEHSKRVKSELQREFPDYRFSVTIEYYTVLNIAIMKAPILFTEKSYLQLNTYHLNTYQNFEILKKIFDIANKGNYDKSDAMTDYFDIGFYLRIEIGKWDKPFELNN